MGKTEIFLGGGGTSVLEAKKAWVSYESSDGSALITEHFVHSTKRGLELSAGRIATTEGVIAALQTLKAIHSVAEFLPEEVLCSAPDLLIWWRPACTRHVHIKMKRCESSTADIALPPLLYVADGQAGLKLFALDSNQRPKPSSPLYVAPLCNVFEGGRVCWGNVSRPTFNGVATISQLEEAFWHSTFTHANVPVGMRRKGGIEGYWRECANGKAPKAFKPSWLQQTKMTLQDQIHGSGD